jgi:hypothetical protein
VRVVQQILNQDASCMLQIHLGIDDLAMSNPIVVTVCMGSSNRGSLIDPTTKARLTQSTALHFTPPSLSAFLILDVSANNFQ